LTIETERLVLRRWRDSDLPQLAAIHADDEVMVWLGSGRLTREASDTYAARCEEHFEQHGFGIWAVERRSDGVLVGATGLRRALWNDHPMTPSVEIAWRQGRFAWGNGYVAEAARAALADGFGRVGLSEVRSWTAATNLRSEKVMQRIGMVRANWLDFELPTLPEGHALRAHVVYTALPD